MPRFRNTAWTILAFTLLTAPFMARPAWAAEDDDGYISEDAASPEKKPEERAAPADSTPAKPAKHKKDKRKYFTDDSPRTDAGIFHVAATVGGNFYIEPQVNQTTKVPTGSYFKDFGFAVGVTFDYDYSEMDENIPLCLRGMIGYKYILNSVHVGTFDGIVRRMWRFSEKSSFGLGFGGSAAIWFRSVTTTSPTEEIIFLPSFVIEGGFDFNPFMIDIRLLINRIADQASIAGAEFYFGFRL